MNGGLVGELISNGSKFVEKNSPVILAGLAVGGVVLTSVLAAKAVPKALAAIREEEVRRNLEAEEKAKKAEEILGKDPDEVYDQEYKPITKKDKFRISFKYFIPAAISAAITIACICGSQHINTVRQAAMAASYEMLRTSFDVYRDNLREEIGNSKMDKIEHKLHEKRVDEILTKKPLTDQELNTLDVSAGAALFCDSETGRRFVSTYEKVYAAVDELNERLEGEDWIGINEFLHMCGDESEGRGLSDIGFHSRPFQKRLDRASICEPIVGEHRGHTCTIVYLNYGEADSRSFL